jgi:hypothetical protein
MTQGLVRLSGFLLGVYNGGGFLGDRFRGGDVTGLNFQGLFRQADVLFEGRAEFRQNTVYFGVRLGRREIGTKPSKACFGVGRHRRTVPSQTLQFNTVKYLSAGVYVLRVPPMVQITS